MRIYLFFVVVFMLASCGTYSPARIVVLQHPETRQTVECKVDPWGHINRKLQIDSCVDAYNKAGYQKLSDSHPPS
jgi:hypothetical protein